jgi:putative ABC transport system substrate-binding protein
MRRREFLGVLGGTAAAWPLAARAQDGLIARVGVLATEGPGTRLAWPAFIDELRKLGFTQGRNLAVEFRRIDQGTPQAFAGANELVAWRADVLFAFGPELALQAAAAARPAVPIVILANNYDPIARGYVQSLSRPGGNVTGIVSRQLELVAKQIELLMEAFPERKRLGALWDVLSADQFAAAERETKARQLTLRAIKMENPPYDFDPAFRALAQDGVDMLHVLGSPLFSQQYERLAELTIQHRLPNSRPATRAGRPVRVRRQLEDCKGDGRRAADLHSAARRRGDRMMRTTSAAGPERTCLRARICPLPGVRAT